MAQLSAFCEEIFLSIQGEGAEVGKPHLFLRFSGCPLRCSYCDTPSSWNSTAKCTIFFADGAVEVDNPIKAADLTGHLQQLCEGYGIAPNKVTLSITGGEPLEQDEFLSNWLPSWPGKQMLETAGVWPDRLSSLSEHFDMVSFDWKLDSTMSSMATMAKSEECLRVLGKGEVSHYVKMVITSDSSFKEVSDALERIASLSPACSVFLQPATPALKANAPSSDLLQAILLANQSLNLSLRVLPQIHPLLNIP